ncbi:MAG: hypothetical protein PHZ26_02545 [Candidatus Gracilibacteria bacterium]|nr:hypothetical protein [Candidatus Gracilibacteria bacterium]MDD2908612.1 hypothetical protein [Candidatus Gracilibacteria bacterium]
MKKLFSIIFLIFLTSCSFFSSKNIQENEKNIQENEKNIQENEKNIKNSSLQKNKQSFFSKEKIIELEKKKFDLAEIDNIKLEKRYLSNLETEYLEKYNLKKSDLTKITREFNNLSINMDAIMFLKGRCNIITGGKNYYDGGKILENSSSFSLKDEYILGSEYSGITGQELNNLKAELNNLFSNNFSELHLKIANTSSYREVISLMGINSANLAYSLEKYSLILILNGKKFDDKKEIFESIFKKFDDKNEINENHLIGMVYLYFYTNKECNGFFDYMVNDFNK